MAVDRYRVVKNGTATPDIILWDGVTRFSPPDGGTLVKEQDWKGPVAEPVVDLESIARVTQEARLAGLLDNLKTDLDRLKAGTATQAQKDAALERVVRATRALIKIQLRSTDATE